MNVHHRVNKSSYCKMNISYFLYWLNPRKVYLVFFYNEVVFGLKCTWKIKSSDILILLSLVNKSMGYLEGKLVGITKLGMKRNLKEILVYNTFFSMMALTLFLPWSNNSDIVVDVNLAAGHQSSRFQ